MPLFAHLTKIALNDKTHNMNDDVSFIEFNGTIDLFKKIHDIFGDQMVDVLNCHYDDKYLIQGFYIYSEEGQHDDFVLVKRLLNDNDQYVYTAELELRQNDEFIHENGKNDQANNSSESLIKKIENILDSRLADLTPKDIKDIIQRMIKEHLGWLVVWGGFFGGLLGFILSPVALNLI